MCVQIRGFVWVFVCVRVIVCSSEGFCECSNEGFCVCLDECMNRCV